MCLEQGHWGGGVGGLREARSRVNKAASHSYRGLSSVAHKLRASSINYNIMEN